MKTYNKTKKETEHIEKPENIQSQDDIDTRDAARFFLTLLAFFVLSFALKYIFPNVPEYIFERILIILLGAFCASVLWKLSPGLRETAKKLFKKISKKEKNITDEPKS